MKVLTAKPGSGIIHGLKTSASSKGRGFVLLEVCKYSSCEELLGDEVHTIHQGYCKIPDWYTNLSSEISRNKKADLVVDVRSATQEFANLAETNICKRKRIAGGVWLPPQTRVFLIK